MTASDYDSVGPSPAPPLTGVTWGKRELIIGTILVLALFFVLGTAIVYPAVQGYGENSVEALLAQAVTVTIWDAGMVGIVYWLVRSKGAGWPQLGLRLPPTGGIAKLAGVIAAAYIGSIVAVNLYEVVIDLTGLHGLEPAKQIDEEFYQHTAALVVLGLAVVLVAPMAEEIFFRGFLFGGLSQSLGVLPAALISGFVFSIAHANVGLIIPFTLIGTFLALSYRYSGSLFASMGVHFLFNFGSFMVLVFVPSAR
jgi:membrane protease YdiL (CAAX protease family)